MGTRSSYHHLSLSLHLSCFLSLISLLYILLTPVTSIQWLYNSSSTYPSRTKFANLVLPFNDSWKNANYFVAYGIDPLSPTTTKTSPNVYDFLNVADGPVTLSSLPNSTFINYVDYRLLVNGLYGYSFNPPIVGLSDATGATAVVWSDTKILLTGGRNSSSAANFNIDYIIVPYSTHLQGYASLKFSGHSVVRCSVELHSCTSVTSGGSTFQFTDGSFIYFGGVIYNGSYVYQSHIYEVPPETLENGVVVEGYFTDPFQTIPYPLIPPARAWHTALLTTDLFMYVFGGKNAVEYFNDLWKYTYWIGWELVNVTMPIPAPRAGHTMYFPKTSEAPMLDDESVFYIFGGENGVTIFSDLWMFNFTTSSWTEILPSGGQNPVARAYHGGGAYYSPNANSTILFFYGGSSSTGNLSSWAGVILEGDCEYECSYAGIKTCTTLTTCIALTSCDWTSSTPYQCNLLCTSTPQICSPTSHCSQVSCWNGECQANISACRPYPICPIGMKRCRDGSCKEETDYLCTTAATCNPPLTLCVDGTCKSVCPLTFGCLPDDNPVQCADGSCESSWSTCNSRCASGEYSCFEGCRSNLSTCSLPTFTSPIIPLPPTIYQITALAGMQDIRVNINSGGTNNIVQKGFLIIQVPSGLSLPYVSFDISMSIVDTVTLRSIGPLPTWDSTFNSTFITSLVVNLKMTNISYLTGLRGTVAFLTEHTLLDNETIANVDIYFCIARAVPWYWDPDDLSLSSPLANVSYIANYRNFTRQYPNANWTDVSSTSPFYSEYLQLPHPTLRWQCLSAAANQWPQWIADTPYLDWFGVVFTEDMNNPVALIAVYAPGDAPQAPPLVVAPTAPTGLAKDREASWIVMGVVSVGLFILIIVVFAKAIQKK